MFEDSMDSHYYLDTMFVKSYLHWSQICNPCLNAWEGKTEITIKERMVETSHDDIVNGAKLLAFPFISTTDFVFDSEMALDIIAATSIKIFKNPKLTNLKLVFVEFSINLDILNRVNAKAIEFGLSLI